MKYTSSITFHYGASGTANAKSVLSVLGACIKSGDEIEIVCEGEDEEEALKGIGGIGRKTDLENKGKKADFLPQV